MTDKKDTQSKIQQLQLLQQNLTNLNLQKQQFNTQTVEIDSAILELEKTDTAYKIVGNIMVASKKEDLKKELLEKKPEAIIKKAVTGMLPKNRLGRKLGKKLFVYTGDQHPHAAQKPEAVEI